MLRRRGSRLFLAALLSMAVLAVGAPLAGAAYPAGTNGKLAFERCDAGFCDIWAGPIGQSINLTNSPAEDEGAPFFFPNGRSIAFERDGRIWKMNANGTGQVQLTAGPSDYGPRVSPDGRLISFARCDGPCDVWVMNADGSAPRNLTNTPAPLDESGADFSPDGRRIAFTRCVGISGCDVYATAIDGGSPVNLTRDSPAFEFGPAFSPDGTLIAIGLSDGGDEDIGVLSSAGGAATTISSGAGFLDAGDAAFSADGRGVIFTRSEMGTGDFDIWSVGPSGSPPAGRLPGSDDATDELSPMWESVHRCGGRVVTLTGDDGPDKIKGTKRADVIAGFGGKDKILGRGGKDRICGGPGKDRLVGGGGADRCLGGKGKDKGGGCEKGKL
jgi:Tol biopolymer transport system component